MATNTRMQRKSPSVRPKISRYVRVIKGLRVRGGSLALRLCTIALVPTLALAGTSYGNIQRERDAASVSADIVRIVSLQRDAAAVAAPAMLERIALEGLAIIDELQIDRSIVTTFTGLDFEGIYDANRVQLDEALENLRSNHPDLTLPDGSDLGERVDELVRGVEVQRERSETRVSRTEDIIELFERVEAVTQAVFTSAAGPAGATADAFEDVAKLRAIAQVSATAGDLTKAVVQVLLYNPAEGRDLVVSAASAHQVRRDAFVALLRPERLESFQTIDSGAAQVPLDLLLVSDGPAGTIASDPSTVAAIASLIKGQLDYLNALNSYSIELHDVISADAAQRAASADNAVRQTMMLVVGIAALTLTLTGFVLHTTARPLTKLSRRAAAVSDGDLSAEPLPLQGPSSVRRLTATVNEMLVTLTGVDEQIEMMSTGNLGAASQIELPGAIGVSMRQSVERLSNMTEQLAHQARHDLLTDIPNRFAAMEHLDELIESRRRYALLFLDIDGFKGVNDTHGHETGDEVLREVARRLEAATRSGEFIARLGGDEFVIVVSNYEGADSVLRLGHRLIQEVEQPYGSDQAIFALSASVGVVTPDPTITSLEALHQADSALYLAKHRGRGRVEVFDADLQARIEHEADLALALRHGVRNEELVLHFQPVMSLDTFQLDHVEALVRWDRPNIGLVFPGEFIPIAERSSLIFEIERWVLKRACEVVADWSQRYPDQRVRMAVNVSGRHLIEGDLLGDLEDVLAQTDADPSMLEFELTETHLLEDLEAATLILNTIRARGIAIAVDDFGTGYSSMNYLRDLPIDTIKIDRSFVARSTEMGYDSTVIEAVLTIARSLELSVVAEGIETQEQLDYVRSVGVHRAQGYLLARPTPIDQAEALMFSRSGIAERRAEHV